MPHSPGCRHCSVVAATLSSSSTPTSATVGKIASLVECYIFSSARWTCNSFRRCCCFWNFECALLFFYFTILFYCVFLHSINFACKLTTFHKSVAFLCWFLKSRRGGVARPTYSCSSWNWSQIRCCCNLYEVWAWQWWPPTNDIASDLACVLICTRISKAFEVRSFAWLSLSCVPNKSKLH